VVVAGVGDALHLDLFLDRDLELVPGLERIARTLSQKKKKKIRKKDSQKEAP
jgi:hypothetical protein